MTRYQFEGSFRDSTWSTLPSPEDVRRSVTAAIAGSSTAVFAITIERVEVTSLGSDLPSWMPGGYPEAHVVVEWQVEQ